MIDPKVISRVRNGVCAVGYLTVPLEEYKRNIQSPFFQVVGTGFLVRETTVITNRHVIQGLFEHQANFGFPSSQFFLSFVAPRDVPQPQITIRMIRRFGALANEEYDVGFLEFKVVTEEHFAISHPLKSHLPLIFTSRKKSLSVVIPMELRCSEKRQSLPLGPVVQRGFISALSPFDTATEPDEILLDVRTAGGMSGAPIFRPSNGEVIGIHHSGWDDMTTALGVPLTKQNVNAWLDLYDNEQNVADQKQTSSGLPTD